MGLRLPSRADSGCVCHMLGGCLARGVQRAGMVADPSRQPAGARRPHGAPLMGAGSMWAVPNGVDPGG